MACRSYDFILLDFFTASFVTGLFLNPLSQEKDLLISVDSYQDCIALVVGECNISMEHCWSDTGR